MTEDTTPIPPSDEPVKRGATEVALVLSAAANVIGTGAYVAEKIINRPKPPEPPQIILPPGTSNE